MSAVVGVRIADVEGQVVGRVRVHLLGRNRIETLRGLPVALLAFGAELARPAADGKGLEQNEAPAAGPLPDLEFGLLFVGADQDRSSGRRVLGSHEGERSGGDWSLVFVQVTRAGALA